MQSNNLRQGGPVAVTPQIKLNTKLELPGEMFKINPGPCMAVSEIGAVGHIAPLLALQVTDVQTRPALEMSLMNEPSAAAGQALNAVTVKLVFASAASVLTTLVLEMPKLALTGIVTVARIALSDGTGSMMPLGD